MKRAPKAYKNKEFLNSREARVIRILSEYLEPENRFDEERIKHTVVFFGSSRIDSVKNGPYNTKRYYWAAEELAYKLACFSNELEKNGEGFFICTGGGPGVMEAANRGARRANSRTIGLNISLPHEQQPNDYISPKLNFEFHYFYMRKLWFLYHAKALVVFPGGYGTLDELFETLTLIQTKKLEKFHLPVILFDKSFWEDLIDFQKLVDYHFISSEDAKLFRYFSTPDEGFTYLKQKVSSSIKNYKKLLL